MSRSSNQCVSVLKTVMQFDMKNIHCLDLFSINILGPPQSRDNLDDIFSILLLVDKIRFIIDTGKFIVNSNLRPPSSTLYVNEPVSKPILKLIASEMRWFFEPDSNYSDKRYMGVKLPIKWGPSDSFKSPRTLNYTSKT